jgi:hypothetical protein
MWLYSRQFSTHIKKGQSSVVVRSPPFHHRLWWKVEWVQFSMWTPNVCIEGLQSVCHASKINIPCSAASSPVKKWPKHVLWILSLKFGGWTKGSKGHFTHEPRAVTMKLWEPKRKCPKAAVPTHLQNHVVWSRILDCNVKSYVIGPSSESYFNEFLFMRVLTLDKME